MKEKRDIIRSYNELQKLEKKCALATVVQVEGSSYRRPGARMLISEDGQLTGAISGGCLEGDAMRKALLVINQQIPALITYDTMDDDDAIIGIGLGCNGIIKILIEPVKYDDEHNPVEVLKNIYSKRQNAVIATFFSLNSKNQDKSGTNFFLDQSNDLFRQSLCDVWSDQIRSEASDVLSSCKSRWTEISDDNGEVITVFLEFVPPCVSLIIAGAGNDVLPMVNMADILGWETTLFDGRANYARKERFAKACNVLCTKPQDVVKNIMIDEYTYFALMTHNYNYDKALLFELCKHNARYIAMLGPKKKIERMLSEFEEEGMALSEKQCASIFCPAGLDIGAETSEEIALSILTEMKAFMSHKTSNHLRHKLTTIHA